MSLETIVTQSIGKANEKSGSGSKTKKRVLENLSFFIRKNPPTTPLNHQPWLYIGANIVLFGSLGLLIGLGYLYPALQNILFPTDNLRFTNNGQYFLIMAWLFIMPFLVSSVTYAKLWVVPSWRNSFFTSLIGEQLRYINQKMSPEEIYKTYDPEKYGQAMIKKYSIITLIIASITLPLQYQALKSGITLNEEGVKINQTFSFTEKKYNWNDVVQAKRSFKEGDSITPQLLIEFSDRKTINLWDIGFSGTETNDLLAALDQLRSRDIFITTESAPSLTSLRKSRQEQIISVFNY